MSATPMAEINPEFRHLVTEIMQAERLCWADAAARARELWPEFAEVDPSEPAGTPARDWRFIAWVLALALIASLAVNATFVWLLATAGAA